MLERICSGKDFRGHQVWHDTLWAAARAQGEAGATSVEMQHEQSFNRTQIHQDGECLVQLLDHVQRLARNRMDAISAAHRAPMP